MSPNTYLIVLFICVIVGLALGLYAAVWIGGLADGAAFAFGGGLGTILVTFGCAAGGIIAMYGVATLIDRFIRRRLRKDRAEKKAQKKRTQKKRRKKK
ncbi:MAG: hypothetical protein ACUVX8_14305 [Candidatus Zipacnadales bacterium]